MYLFLLLLIQLVKNRPTRDARRAMHSCLSRASSKQECKFRVFYSLDFNYADTDINSILFPNLLV